MPYDIERELQPVALVTTGYMLLAVSPKSEFNSVNFAALIRRDSAKWAEVVKRSGAKID